MTSSLLPERPILISPSLAATVGLEEATMLSVLGEITRLSRPVKTDAYHWYDIDLSTLQAILPFWNSDDLQRVSQSLRAKGVIVLRSAPLSQSGRLLMAYNETATAQMVPPPQHSPQSANPVGATAMAPDWSPNKETVTRIGQHNIPMEFIREQVPEFVTYWRESGEHHRAWGAKFHQHVVHKWRLRETFTAQAQQETGVNSSWRPSQDALDVLTQHAGINPQFVEDSIPEFTLYWSERGEKSRTWNSKFIQHVRRQWARFCSALEHDTEPKRIPENWSPGDDVMDVLTMANIDHQFALSLVPEFVLYWRDSNQLYASWNTKFLQHVKYHWAKQHQLPSSQGTTHDNKVTAIGSNRTRDRSLFEDLNDRSWAN